VPLSRLLGAASFRLVATYLAIFALSALILGCVVYFSVGREIILQLDERLNEEAAALKGDFTAHGMAQLAEDVRARAQAGGSLDYRLEDDAGRLIAGNLPPSAAADHKYREGMVEFIKPEPEAGGVGAADWERALVAKLGADAILVVGDELTGVAEARRAVLVAFAWGLAATIILGALGGLAISAVFLRRIDAMTATAQEIINGDLARRIPTTRGDADLSRLASAFNRLLDRTAALLEANKHVSSDIAHDLRSPLAKALRRLESVRTHPAEAAEIERAVDAAIEDIHGVLATFAALLRIGQIEAGARRAGFKNVDLAAIAAEVAEAFQPAAADEGKVLRFELEAPLPMAGDRELLTQLVANLIDNAIRHTQDGAEIWIRSEARRLLVADNGPGVPQADLARIFERFYRVDRARAAPGDGLGLSLVAAVAALHGARVSAASRDPGLMITLELPAAESERRVG